MRAFRFGDRQIGDGFRADRLPCSPQVQHVSR